MTNTVTARMFIPTPTFAWGTNKRKNFHLKLFQCSDLRVKFDRLYVKTINNSERYYEKIVLDNGFFSYFSMWKPLEKSWSFQIKGTLTTWQISWVESQKELLAFHLLLLKPKTSERVVRPFLSLLHKPKSYREFCPLLDVVTSSQLLTLL